MERIVGDMILLADHIKRITDHSESEEIQFQDGMDLIFSNGRKKRADSVKRLSLQNGDFVIAIGRISKVSDLTAYGYEIHRSGIVSQGPLAFVRGKCENISPFSISVEAGRKTVCIFSRRKVKEETEKERTFLCSVTHQAGCTRLCETWTPAKCVSCRKNRKQSRLILLEEALREYTEKDVVC